MDFLRNLCIIKFKLSVENPLKCSKKIFDERTDDIMKYRSWTSFIKQNDELPENERLYTKERLSRLGSKPKKYTTGESHDIKVGGSYWKAFQFFKLAEAEKKRTVSKAII